MVGEALRGAEGLFLAMRLVLVDLGNGIDHPRAFAGEEVLDVDKIASRMNNAADIQGQVLVLPGGVGRQAIGHPLDGDQIGVAPGQDIIEILTRVLAPAQAQTDRLFAFEQQHRGVHPFAPGWRVGLVFPDQRQQPGTGVVLIDPRLIRTQAFHPLVDRVGAVGDLLDQIPLGSIGQGHAHHGLERLDAFERQTEIIVGHGQVHLEAHRIGLPVGPGRQAGNREIATQPTAQPLQLEA
jgi:hypothetical protein